jgi:hypothetical protein
MRVNVILKSAYGVKKEFVTFDSEDEAYDFCDFSEWQWEDANGFVWDMDYQEVFE